MSPLRIEACIPSYQRWVEVGVVNPGDHPGSLSDNKEDGRRDIYQFTSDTEVSRIYRLGLGLDTEVGGLRITSTSPSRELIAELRKGQSYEMSIKTDRSPEQRRIRFTHF